MGEIELESMTSRVQESIMITTHSVAKCVIKSENMECSIEEDISQL